MALLTVLRPGMFTTVQDLGRWGYQTEGVPVSGALDPLSHRLANRLLGNEAGAATLEVTLIGPQLRFERETAFAVAGADFRLTLDDTTVNVNRRVEARAGATLKFGERIRGARAYVAVDRGIGVPEMLGSRSTHVLSRIGGHDGRALRAGDVLDQVDQQVGGGFPAHLLTTPPDWFRQKLRVIPVDEALAASLTSQKFQVSPRSDRMGYRLDGGTIAPTATGELISTAVPTGAIQVPPSGQPILLMNDHATTGGYAIAAVVIAADLPCAGQLAPGDRVEFERCSVAEALDALRRQEALLDA
jgi:antagonist of KipI